MATYLIDFENVRDDGLEGINRLTMKDQVLVFYTNNALNINMDILNSTTKIKFIKVECGTPNALDFQMVAYLFHYSKKREKYIIVSCDKGYDVVVNMSKKLGVNLSRSISINRSLTEMSQNTMLKNVSVCTNSDNTSDELADSAFNENVVVSESEYTTFINSETIYARLSKTKKIENVCELYGINPEEYLDDPDCKKVNVSQIKYCDEKNTETTTDSKETALRKILKEQLGIQPSSVGLMILSSAIKACENREDFYRYCIGRYGSTTGRHFYKSVRSKFETMKCIIAG